MRIGLDDYFMKIAKVVAERSTCLRTNVGAVLVKDKYILATGYNGPPREYPHCTKCLREGLKRGEDLDRCPAVHAEQNVIIQSALHGASPAGGEIYCTHFPCVSCLRMLINAGIMRLVYETPYDMDNQVKKELVEKNGIRIEKYGGEK